MNLNFLEFEKPIAELEAKIEELRRVGSDTDVNLTDEIDRLQTKSRELAKQIFSHLTSAQIVQLARHPLRPYTADYISRIFTDFDELQGTAKRS
jgi:acetyl-CoA carboxylase carboxyl transferase subunit alpha